MPVQSAPAVVIGSSRAASAEKSAGRPASREMAPTGSCITESSTSSPGLPMPNLHGCAASMAARAADATEL
eukprot:7388005-Prymnesium_polylepis.1